MLKDFKIIIIITTTTTTINIVFCHGSFDLGTSLPETEVILATAVFSVLLTYLLTPWSRVLPEKLKRPELLKKFPAFYGTRRFITAFTRARHLSLS
jgi:hypothetical protein